MTLALVLGYAGLLLLTLLALLYSHWPGWLKGLLVVAVSALYFVGYDVVHALIGLPSADALPERFIMLSAAVDEPTPKSPGAVYLWVSALRDGQSGLDPRAYRLPYDKALHEQVDAALKRARDGVNQMGTAENRPAQGAALGWLKAKAEQDIRLRDLPARPLPEK